MDQEARIRALEEENTLLRKRLQQETERFVRREKELEDTIYMYKKQWLEVSTELDLWKKQGMVMQAYTAQVKAAPELSPVEVADFSVLEEVESIDTYIGIIWDAYHDEKIAVVGGTKTWQTKMAKTFPNVVCISSKKFKPEKLADVALVIINTNNTSHAETQKAKDIANAKGIPTYLTDKYNIEKIASDIADLLTQA